MIKKKLPLISMQIDPSNGSYVSAIAIVDRPAIGSNFIAFSNDSPKTMLAFSEERMELVGAAMIPNLPMYRNTPGIGEYMSVFDEDTIRSIAQVFAHKGLFKNMNIQHTDKVADSFVFQSYIVDVDKGMLAPKGIDAPNGSWIVGVKVLDPVLWADIKGGVRNGFSVEGLFDLIETDLSLDIVAHTEEIKLAQAFEDALKEIPKGCLMFFPEVDARQWELKARSIAPNAVELELDPHITILYGFPDAPENIEMLRGFLAESLNAWPLNIELGAISKFTNSENDVIKIDVVDINGALRGINSVLSDMFMVVSDYGAYKPHMTVGYVEPNPGVTFSSDTIYPWEFGINYLNKGRLVYSDAERNKTELLIIK